MRWRANKRDADEPDPAESVDWLFDMELDNIFFFDEILRTEVSVETTARPELAADSFPTDE